jgi:hypothetical protein
MRALILFLPLCAALAGDTSPLAEATRQWRSDSADDRDEASRVVRAHLERELKPLLEALKADDPEVRRRARTALEGLLPERPADEMPAGEEAGWGQVMFFGGGGQGGGNQQIRVVVQANGQVMFVQQELAEVQALKAKGITGQPVDDPLLRDQLRLAEGRGFAVTDIDAQSEADKLGLRPRDILLAVGGRPVKQAADVAEGLKVPNPEIRLLRRGEVLVLAGKGREGAGGEGR